MGAPVGSKNALGNKGGRRPNAKIEKQINTFKGLVLSYVIKIMKGKDEEKKYDTALKSIVKVMPQAMEISGENGQPITVKIINFKDGNNTST